MKYFVLSLFALSLLQGCASVKVAENVKMVSFSDKPTTKETKALGNIEGKDCTWYVLGYPLGHSPTVRTAFQNTAEQSEEKIPLMKAKKEGAVGNISYIRNVSVEPSGFSAWVVGRSCMNVTGVGYQ
ncbi:hypothetical protein D3C87_126150 [compost metagenome]